MGEGGRKRERERERERERSERSKDSNQSNISHNIVSETPSNPTTPRLIRAIRSRTGVKLWCYLGPPRSWEQQAASRPPQIPALLVQDVGGRGGGGGINLSNRLAS